MSAPGWPARLADGPVGIRPLRLRDGASWVEVRTRNEQWLVRWEATPPGFDNPRLSWNDRQSIGIYTAMLRSLRKQGREGSALPFAITYEGRFCGQLTVGNVVRGAFNSAYVGYWVDEAVAGRGVMPTALALVVDHCFGPARLHRIEANIRPENVASKRVVEKLGFRDEGLHRKYLAIDGAYRDHIGYAVTVEDVPEGMLRRWHRVRQQQS
ncbi:MAG TPA: GNAT family protein [Frankiaceae bacterium]|nr:GNAT family protein [Frankiaceae bacterium]